MHLDRHLYTIIYTEKDMYRYTDTHKSTAPPSPPLTLAFAKSLTGTPPIAVPQHPRHPPVNLAFTHPLSHPPVCPSSLSSTQSASRPIHLPSHIRTLPSVYHPSH